ncbi:MAG: putative rane protein [Acidobacteriota bacterium]|nr:putative rane protein [Acidobacteriota bacterium]
MVVEVRSRSGSYAQGDARFGAVLAFVALLVLLFSPWHFAAPWVAIDVVVAYGVGVLVAGRSDSVRRLMTSERERMAQVRAVSMATFHDRGVANTEGESGVLVYLSILERHIEVLADRGVLVAVPALEWNRIIDDVRRSRSATPETLVELIRALMPLLGTCLPVREGDRDELANEPRYVPE